MVCPVSRFLKRVNNETAFNKDAMRLTQMAKTSRYAARHPGQPIPLLGTRAAIAGL